MFDFFYYLGSQTNGDILKNGHGEHVEVLESGSELAFRLHLLRRYRRPVCSRPSTRVCALLIVTAG